MKKYCYLARPMGSYAIPGTSLIPKSLYENYKAQGYTFVDPAFDLELGDVTGKGMTPWTRFIELHCEAVIAITSMNVVTAGVSLEMETAASIGLRSEWPYLTAPNVLDPKRSRMYNQLGLLVLESDSHPNRFNGFIATVNHKRHVSIPEITLGQH
jgi:hypothetical protein